MRPGEREFDEEIRAHLALEVRERIERGEDPESARYAALREFGNVTLTRESMQAIWRPRCIDLALALCTDMRVAARSLRHAKGLAATVAITLALGIGANAAIYSVVEQVLHRPLVNRDENRLVYIRQSAPGRGAENTTFSMPEIADFRTRVKSIAAFGDFSTIDFTLVGLGEPRVVRAGVVDGSYFDVMGLYPALGRLLNSTDDGPDAAGAAVLAYRFWSTTLSKDPHVIGRVIRLGSRSATVVGVLEPSIPYPADTEIIANVVTSPHHLGATMVRERTHRMTELFGRLAPGATLEDARQELRGVHAAMMQEHPQAYSAAAHMQLAVSHLRDQITAPARTVLLMLLAVAGIVFAIACSNVANLILARAVYREKEFTVRAALGASPGALRRMLLAESLVLSGIGAILGLLLARPLVAAIAAYAARFSVRALDVTLDTSVVWVGAILAMVAAVILAYIPRLPPAHAPHDAASHSVRVAPGTSRRLRAFALTQMALSFVLLAGAGMILSALVRLQTVTTGYNMRQVLALDVPLPLEAGDKAAGFYEEVMRRVSRLPGVSHAAVGSFVPWRDVTNLLPTMPFRVEGYTPEGGEEDPRARLRSVTPGFFGALGVPLLAGRDFTDADGRNAERVVIVSDSVAQRLFPSGDALHRHLWWTDPLFGKPQPRRIVGVVADVDDENVVPKPTNTVYHPLRQLPYAGRLFVHADGDPYALVEPVRKTIREISVDQPVERAATLQDVRAKILAPERLTAFVFAVFAGVALLIAVVGVAGVLAFYVSARTREFGVRLAIGSARRHLLMQVLSQGVRIAMLGILAGAGGGYACAILGTTYFAGIRVPGVVPMLGAAAVLVGAAVLASLIPALRAARVDVIQVLRSE